MAIEKGKLGLILLGSQNFPKSKNFGSSTAFYQSYSRIKSFFTDSTCIGLETNDVLDLFDCDKGPDEQDHLIANYIDERRCTNDIVDLIIYYIGHGGYAPQNGGFLLAIKSTRDNNLGVSSITMKSLAVTISKHARNLRCVIILDCCFSADARNVFQSPVQDVIRKSLQDGHPSKGIALFCSSSGDAPSLIVNERNITMFTEGLEKALRTGSLEINNRYLTLRQLQKLTFKYISDLNPGESVRPEIHTPDQSLGDIADIPYFPNPGFKINGYDIKLRRRLLEYKIIENDLEGVSAFFMDFVNDFDLDNKYEIDMVLIASDCSELHRESKLISKNENIADATKERFQDKRKTVYKQILTIISDLVTNQLVP